MMKRLLLIACLLWSQYCLATIAFDAATDGIDNGGSTSSLTWSHTSTGTDRIGFVCALGDNINGGADDVTGVTWGGSAMTLAAKNTTNIATANNHRFAYLYYIVGQASGAQNIVVSASTSHYILAGSSSYTGVNATGQLDATTVVNRTVDDATLTLTTSITTVNNNAWTVLCETGISSGGAAPTAGAGSTRRVYGAAFGNWGIFDSNAAVSPAGSYSMTTDVTGSIGIVHIMASFKPVSTSRTCSGVGLLGLVAC